jgi:hypothetical protein
MEGLKKGVLFPCTEGVMNRHAQALFCNLQQLFATPYQRTSFKVLLALFLKGDGRPHPHHAHGKSPAALSRFLNRYRWNTRRLIRQTRHTAVQSLMRYDQRRRGRRPKLLVMIDLTTLEKAGRFQQFNLVRILNRKRGLQVVMLYLVAGPLRVPWSFRIWRGKGEASASMLALNLLRQLPTALTQRYEVLVLADGGFGNTLFLEGVRKLGLDAVVGMRNDRHLEDGRQLHEVRSGEQVTPTGLSFSVTVARYTLKRQDGRETRVVVATFSTHARNISRWGKRRWRIEGFFKTIKGRFGLARFAQQSLVGVLRFLVLSLLSFILVQWQVWSVPEGEWPHWQKVAKDVRRQLVPELLQAELLAELERLQPYLDAAKASGT